MPETRASLRAMGVAINSTDGQIFSGISFAQEGNPAGRRRISRRTWDRNAPHTPARTHGCEGLKTVALKLLWRTPVQASTPKACILSAVKFGRAGSLALMD